MQGTDISFERIQRTFPAVDGDDDRAGRRYRSRPSRQVRLRHALPKQYGGRL
jgi:hypothetical protein